MLTKMISLASTAVLLAIAAGVSPASATTIEYSLAGALGNDLINGVGTAQVNSTGIVTGLDFTVLGKDPAWAGYVGTYTENVASDSTIIWASNSTPNATWIKNNPAGTIPSVIFAISGWESGATSNVLTTGGTQVYDVQYGFYNPIQGEGFGTSNTATLYVSVDPAQVSTVPLPGSFTLFGSGLAGLAGLVTTRRRKTA